MKQAKTTKQPLEVPKFELGQRVVTKNKATKKEGVIVGNGRFVGTISVKFEGDIIGEFLPEQLEAAPDSKEGLHTQEHEFWLRLNEGEEDEQVMTLGQYIAAFDEAEDGVSDDIMPVLNLGQDEAIQFGADFIRRISTPPNERKALLDSHRELLDIVKRLDYWHHLENGVFTYTNPNHDGDQLVIDLQTAIQNAGKINY